MSKPCVLITGGAGFIGFHATRHFLKKGFRVVVVDNLSRKGTQHNLQTLQSLGKFHFEHGDIRSPHIWERVFHKCIPRADLVIHLAAQVAVTTSVKNPKEDFEINCAGTFNLLESLRKLNPGKKPKLVIYASTNKVYGDLRHYPLNPTGKRYRFLNGKEAIAETEPLDFHSPYGCSKGSAEQYIHDYKRVYGLPTVVLRQSCIYGTQQFGLEEQGWVAHFGIQSYLSRPLTIYGDGKQVRDLLYVDDLVRLYELLFKNGDLAAGQIYNVGGGPENTLSLLELVEHLGKRLKKSLKVNFASWRVGDQKIFVADVGRLKDDLHWYPKVRLETGLERLFSWIETHIHTIKKVIEGRPARQIVPMTAGKR